MLAGTYSHVLAPTCSQKPIRPNDKGPDPPTSLRQSTRMTNCTSIPTHSVRAAAAVYLRRGMFPVPVPQREKGAIVKGWPDLRLTAADLPDFFPDDLTANVGLHLDPAANVADV